MSLSQKTIAIVYDYDQTLSPTYMQDDVIFPKYGIDSQKFWKQCDALVKDQGWDNELAYMRVMLETLVNDPPSNAELREMGKQLSFNPGVLEMFSELPNCLSEEQRNSGITIEHYIVSSGIRELIEGSALKPHLKRIFACEFAENSDGKICFPKKTISHTQKTQYLFRINKGLLDDSDDVNDHMPEEMRRIPFSNMVYVGDGPTDVPCFTIMKHFGGQAIAVYNPLDDTRKCFQKCYTLANADRVRHIAPSDYRPNSHLRMVLEAMVQEIAEKTLIRDRVALKEATISAPEY